MRPSCPTIAAGEVHVWPLSLDMSRAETVALAKILSADEIVRADAFRQTEHRAAYVAARGQLRQILGEYLRVEPASIEFSYTSRGKPEILTNPIHFTISHSATRALCAFSVGVPIGVDLEYKKKIDNLDSLALQIMSPLESLLFAELPSQRRLDAFYDCWTRKEAYLKARGLGVVNVLRDVSVSLSEEAQPKLLQCEDPGESPDAWSLYSYRLPEDYAAALAVREKVHRCTWQQPWPESPITKMVS
ncbi:MAG: 4'-phosphopantetheinyl transferase superfamily protein [Tahibacter sp.]